MEGKNRGGPAFAEMVSGRMDKSVISEGRCGDGALRQRIERHAMASFRECVRADARAHGGLRRAVQVPGFWCVFSYRAAYWLRRRRLDFVAILVQLAAQLLFGCEISRKAIIGPSFVVTHPSAVFIGPHSAIGKGCTVGSGVYIGSNSHPDDPDDYALVDDKVAIGPGGRVMGPVVIGAGSQIGPNTVVLRSVPANSLVMSPAPRVIARDTFSAKSPANSARATAVTDLEEFKRASAAD